MTQFTATTGPAASLLLPNINTDLIVPVARSVRYARGELGPWLFETLRYGSDGRENPDFILNIEPFRHTRILLGGENFGCGSSRETAVWALLDFGIQSVIAPSFGEIFYNNCFQNGILPIVLPSSLVTSLHEEAVEGNPVMTIDLEAQQIQTPRRTLSFDVEAFRRTMLLEGIDEVELTLRRNGEIEAFQKSDAKRRSWMRWDEPSIIV